MIPNDKSIQNKAFQSRVTNEHLNGNTEHFCRIQLLDLFFSGKCTYLCFNLGFRNEEMILVICSLQNLKILLFYSFPQLRMGTVQNMGLASTGGNLENFVINRYTYPDNQCRRITVCTCINIINLFCGLAFWKLTLFAKGDILILFLGDKLRRKYFDKFMGWLFQIWLIPCKSNEADYFFSINIPFQISCCGLNIPSLHSYFNVLMSWIFNFLKNMWPLKHTFLVLM